jgi:hypothetical protein
MLNRVIRVLFPTAALCFTAIAAELPIPSGAKIFIAPMGGFETYLKAAIETKKVPVAIVETREAAEFRAFRRGRQRKSEYREEDHHAGLAFQGTGQHQGHQHSIQRGHFRVFGEQGQFGAREAKFGGGLREAFEGSNPDEQKVDRASNCRGQK